MRSDLPHPSVRGEERDARRIEAWPLRRYVDVPAVPGYASVGERRHERGGAQCRFLWSGPGARRPRSTDPANALVTGDAAYHAGHRRYEVHVAMRVPRLRDDSPGARHGRLGADLGGELAGTDTAAEKPFCELGEPEKPSLGVDEAPDQRRVADRPATHEVDVQANLEVRLHPRLRRRLGGRVGGHDERCRADDAAAVRLEGPSGDARGEAEVGRGD